MGRGKWLEVVGHGWEPLVWVNVVGKKSIEKKTVKRSNLKKKINIKKVVKYL